MSATSGVSLDGQTVLVTGASRGLGQAIALEFARRGAHVLGIGRDVEALRETAEAAAGLAGSIETTVLDVGNEVAVQVYFESNPRLDIVVNNAGVARIRPLLDTPTAELREILETNVVAAFVVMREAARQMADRGRGHIINIASDAALRGIEGMAPYVASKHALLGLGRTLQLELGPRGVRCTTLCPGPLATDILGPGTADPRFMPPAAVAKLVADLAELPPSVAIPEVLLSPQPT